MQATLAPHKNKITVNSVKAICRLIKEFDALTLFEVKSYFREVNNYYLHSTDPLERKVVEELKNCVEHKLNKA